MPDFPELVDEHFDVHGPYSIDLIITAMWSAARLMHYLARATATEEHQVKYGPDVRRVVEPFADLVATAVQVTQQLGQATLAIADDPTLYDDRGCANHSAQDTALLVAAALKMDARGALAQAGQALTEAHGKAAYLGHC